MDYPSRIVTIGDPDVAVVKQLQDRLNQLGCGPILADGVFGKNTAIAVKDFQSRYSDINGHPLVVDGKVGSLTWASLFDTAVTRTTSSSPLITEVFKIAKKEIGVCEVPPYSNSGPRVEEYLKSVRIGPGYAWCAAFAYWCFNQASEKLNVPNPLVRTAGCIQHWNNTKGVKVVSADAINNPLLIEPGSIFIMSRGSGLGHTGIVTGIKAGYIQTIEGNTNTSLSATGGSVCQLWRKINTINVGFIKYS